MVISFLRLVRAYTKQYAPLQSFECRSVRLQYTPTPPDVSYYHSSSYYSIFYLGSVVIVTISRHLSADLVEYPEAALAHRWDTQR